MNTKIAKELIEKYQAGTARPDELAIIEKWVMLGTVNELDLSDEELANDFSMIRNQLPLKYGPKQVKLWPRAAGIAAAVAAITLGVWFYQPVLNLFQDHLEGSALSSRVSRDLYTNDVAPGKNKATLKIGDGEAIALSDKQTGVIVGDDLRYSDNTLVIQSGPLSSRANGLSSRANAKDPSALGMTTITTPRGGTYQITLPDGTRAWLNADSKISFPSQFIGKERKILLLYGEAYFEVAKLYTSSRTAGRDLKRVPFIVATSNQRIEVLGTHFNVNAYTDESVGAGMRTTLLEGSVKVTDGGKSMVMKPGTQAYSSPDGLRALQVNPEEAIAWKNGLFTYHNTMLDEVLLQAARWYDVAIVYESVALRQKQLSGSVTRYDKLSNLLNAISYTAGVKFKVKDRTVYVYKK